MSFLEMYNDPGPKKNCFSGLRRCFPTFVGLVFHSSIPYSANRCDHGWSQSPPGEQLVAQSAALCGLGSVAFPSSASTWAAPGTSPTRQPGIAVRRVQLGEVRKDLGKVFVDAKTKKMSFSVLSVKDVVLGKRSDQKPTFSGVEANPGELKNSGLPDIEHHWNAGAKPSRDSQKVVPAPFQRGNWASCSLNSMRPGTRCQQGMTSKRGMIYDF